MSKKWDSTLYVRGISGLSTANWLRNLWSSLQNSLISGILYNFIASLSKPRPKAQPICWVAPPEKMKIQKDFWQGQNRWHHVKRNSAFPMHCPYILRAYLLHLGRYLLIAGWLTKCLPYPIKKRANIVEKDDLMQIAKKYKVYLIYNYWSNS